MKKVSYILVVIAIAMILLGTIFQYVNYKCNQIDKNTDFWARNCDYEK